MATPVECIEDEYDLIFLSDFEDNDDALAGCEQSKGKGRAGAHRSSPVQAHSGTITNHSVGHTTRDNTAQQSPQCPSQDDAENDSGSSGKEGDEDDNNHAGNKSDEDEDEPEEIEYEFENDSLLIMPGMLRGYSHHATNYHPELWQAPMPGDYTSDTSKTVAQLRAEDRRLDREEILKSSIPSTTCGICFESFSTFDLGSSSPGNASSSSPSSLSASELTMTERIEETRKFTFQVARSFGMVTGASTTASARCSPTSDHINSFSTTPQPSPQPTSVTTAQRPESTSSKEIGIIMPCQHGLCLSCLQTYLIHNLQDPKARFPTQCPQSGCRSPIPVESGELVLERELLEKWYRKLAEIHVANKVCCPRPECGAIIDLDDRDGPAVQCPECQTSYCASCAVPLHRGFTCEEYRAQAEGGASTEEDRAMYQLIKDRRWRHCPSCRFVIEKTQGCPHVICHCGQSMCFSCGSTWDEQEARCSENCGNPDYIPEVACIIM